ncbi:MAG: glycosyltransferase [Candidatus Woesearchaeota archaeon]
MKIRDNKKRGNSRKERERLPFITIITPVKHESKYIVECVSSLLNLDYPKDRHEIIVVMDRDATKEVGDALRFFRGRIKVIKDSKRGSAAHRNLGAKNASKKAKYFAFTDADCIVSRQWLKALVRRMEEVQKEDSSIGCVGGLNFVPKTDSRFAKLVGALEQTLLGSGGSAQSAIRKKERIVESIPNCNAMYKKGLWGRNRQDESLIIGQDGEFNYRLRKKGVRFIVIPGAIVWHHRTSSLKGYIRRMYKYGVAAARIAKMHPGILRTRWYALLSLAGMIAALALLILSLISIPAMYAFISLAGIYILMLLATTAKVLMSIKGPIALLTPLLLFFQHGLYNIGFLAGLFR